MSEVTSWAELPSAAQRMIQRIVTDCRTKAADAAVDSYGPERTLEWAESDARNVCTFTAEWTRERENEVAITICAVALPVVQTTDSTKGTFLTGHPKFAPTLIALEGLNPAALKSGPTPDHRTITVRL